VAQIDAIKGLCLGRALCLDAKIALIGSDLNLFGAAIVLIAIQNVSAH
jgi:hypothetical protein